jgi:hypothetical protein
MRSTPRALTLLLLGAALLFLPSAAFAGAPTTAPAEIRSEGFETAPAADWLIEPVGGQFPPPAAWWGRVTQRAYSGSYGLWCAGSPNGWGTGLYPNFAGGLATLNLPQLADYYSATLSYEYTMPSLGSDDGLSLNILWDSTPHTEWDYHYARPLTAASTWRTDAWDMSAPGNAVNISRQPGRVRFQFLDFYGNTYESPKAGEGATIDDVLVTGYKYGPVRGLAATTTGSDVQLSWAAPARSTATGAIPEERSVTYRVWRAPNVVPYVWSELTTDRTAATAFTDTDTAALRGPYRYVVQTWDPGTGGGYGVLDPTATGQSVTRTFVADPLAPAFTITGIPSSPTPNAVLPGVSTTETPRPAVSAMLDGLPFTIGSSITAEGFHGLVVRITTLDDRVAEQVVSFTIDRHAPSTTSDAPRSTVLAPVTVHLSVVDGPAPNPAGVRATYYSLDGAAYKTYAGSIYVSSYRDHTLSYYSVDNAGNKESTHSVTFSNRFRETLSVKSSVTTGRYRHSFTLSGYLYKGYAGDHVYLKYQRPGSSTWYSVTRHATAASGTRGRWSYSFFPTKKGTYHFKAYFGGTTARYKVTSPTISVVVK